MNPVVYLRTYAMGCDFEVFAWSSDSRQARVGAEAAIEEILRTEALLSHYLPDSEISYINQHAASSPVRVHPEVFDLLCKALQLCQKTEGAFDITVMPLLECWGFHRGVGRVPSQRALARALRRVGYHQIQLDPENLTVAFSQEGVSLHLGAIGKGYAVDKAIECLQGAGVEAAMVHGGYSSVRAYGCLPGGEGWRVRLPHPLTPQHTLAHLALNNRAISTSASVYQHFERGGRRYGHIIDPRSGLPVPDILMQVSVIADEATVTDALATAFFVLGEAAIEKFVQSEPNIQVGILRDAQSPLVWIGSVVPVGETPYDGK